MDEPAALVDISPGSKINGDLGTIDDNFDELSQDEGEDNSAKLGDIGGKCAGDDNGERNGDRERKGGIDDEEKGGENGEGGEEGDSQNATVA